MYGTATASEATRRRAVGLPPPKHRHPVRANPIALNPVLLPRARAEQAELLVRRRSPRRPS